jgi:hypothetical protein
MEKRKVVYQDGTYQVLKPKNGSNGWHENGERKSLHGLSDFLEKEEKKFEFEISDEIKKVVEKYQLQRMENFFQYYERSLKSKLI